MGDEANPMFRRREFTAPGSGVTFPWHQLGYFAMSLLPTSKTFARERAHQAIDAEHADGAGRCQPVSQAPGLGRWRAQTAAAAGPCEGLAELRHSVGNSVAGVTKAPAAKARCSLRLPP